MEVMDMGAEQWIGSPSSSSSSREQHDGVALAPAKRPAGRTKFRETRHPVYRGVRRRDSAGRWVCEVRVPGKRGERLWLGTHVTADAAMLALRGRSTPFLNFADSAWLLDVPNGITDHADVRRAALAAVVEFQRKRANDCVSVSVNEVTSGASAPSSSLNNAGSSAAPSSQPSADGKFERCQPRWAPTCSSWTCPGKWTWGRTTRTDACWDNVGADAALWSP